jgi:endonuclease/exonuclease/phosphatase family metal-dependent hydrolase
MRYLLLILLLAAPARAQLLDGNGAEHPLSADDRADGGLVELRASAFADGLWLGFEFADEIDADSGSGFVLHLDADGDPATGDEHGCELVFDLMARHGSLHPPRDLPGEGRLFRRLGLEIAPAYASRSVELFIPRSIRGGESIFSGPAVELFVVARGDRVPDDGAVRLRWADDPVRVKPISLERTGQLRVASWNLERDGLFDVERQEAQDRILQVLDADVLVVCESFNRDADEVLARAAGFFSHAVKADPGNVLLSRHPILESWAILSAPTDRRGYRGSAVLVDAPRGPFLVLPQHWRCCAKGESSRLFEADATIGFLRDAFTEGGNFSLPSRVPFIVIGDLNLVTSRRPLDVVLSGIVIDKDSYGPDFPPGPGGTGLRVVELRHSDAPFLYTWHSGETKYYSARLDWALVPTGVSVDRSFVLDTGTMFGSRLEEYGLRRGDSRVASDHMPIVVDVSWK